MRNYCAARFESVSAAEFAYLNLKLKDKRRYHLVVLEKQAILYCPRPISYIGSGQERIYNILKPYERITGTRTIFTVK